MDITGFMSWFISIMLFGVSFIFNTLDNIKFAGVTLLEFCIALVLIPIGLSILVAVVKTDYISSKSSKSKSKKEEKSE